MDWIDNDVYLKGTLTIVVRGQDGRPRAGRRVTVCGYG